MLDIVLSERLGKFLQTKRITHITIDQVVLKMC